MQETILMIDMDGTLVDLDQPPEKLLAPEDIANVPAQDRIVQQVMKLRSKYPDQAFYVCTARDTPRLKAVTEKWLSDHGLGFILPRLLMYDHEDKAYDGFIKFKTVMVERLLQRERFSKIVVLDDHAEILEAIQRMLDAMAPQVRYELGWVNNGVVALVQTKED